MGEGRQKNRYMEVDDQGGQRNLAHLVAVKYVGLAPSAWLPSPLGRCSDGGISAHLEPKGEIRLASNHLEATAR